MSDYAFLNTAIGISPVKNYPTTFGNAQQSTDSVANQSNIDRFEKQNFGVAQLPEGAEQTKANSNVKKSNTFIILGGLALGAGLIAIFHKPIGKFLGIGKAKNLGNATPNLTSSTKKAFDAVESEKLGMDYVEKYLKEAEKKYMRGKPTHKNMTDAEFEKIWATRKNELLNSEIGNIENTYLKKCLDNAGKDGNLGMLGFNHPSKDAYIQFAETLANKQGYTITNLRDVKGWIGFDLVKM